MTDTALSVLKTIYINRDKTRDSENLYNVFIQKNKNYSKKEWNSILEELSNSSFISVNDSYVELCSQSLVFDELQKHKDDRLKRKNFIQVFLRNLFK